MKAPYEKLFAGNKKWIEEKLQVDPDYFKKLAAGQSPEFLWIGCSDSRVPANEVTGTEPGEIFVHRNIANMVVHTDMNMLSVLDYAVNVLQVKHVIVCGHYGCGGVLAAMGNKQFGLIDNWLRHIKDIYRFHRDELDAIEDETERGKRFVEINVIEQVYDLCKTSIIQNSWASRNMPEVHGWVYELSTGIINDLNVTVRDNRDIESVFKLDALNISKKGIVS